MRDDISYHECFVELHTGFHGHFAQHLASAWFIADSGNRRLIEKTWPHLIEKAGALLEERSRA